MPETLEIPSADDDLALCRRIEEASLNAWPAMHQILLDGWVLRFARGFTKRANSITPLYVTDAPHEAKIRYCENLYAREKLQTIFRLTSLGVAPGLDTLLQQRGYAVTDPTLVLYRDLRAPGAGEVAASPVKLVALEPWLAAYQEITGLPDSARAIQRVLLASIRTDTAYAVLEVDDRPIACALGVLDQSYLGLFDLATHRAHRRHGAAGTLVRRLMAWAAAREGEYVYLQMLSSNAAAAEAVPETGLPHPLPLLVPRAALRVRQTENRAGFQS